MSDRATGDEIGEETWRLIATSDDPALFEEFIRRFPDHPRLMMAKLALQRLSLQLPSTPLQRSDSQASAGDGDAAWERIDGTATVQDLGLFLAQFPDHPRALAARLRLEALKASVPRHHVNESAGDLEARRQPPPRPQPSAGSGVGVVVLLLALAAGAWLYLQKPSPDDMSSTASAQPPRAVEPAPVVATVAQPTVKASIAANVPKIEVERETVSVSWTSSGASNCTVRNSRGVLSTNLSGSISGTTNTLDPLRFTITCSDDKDTVSDSVVVEVVPADQNVDPQTLFVINQTGTALWMSIIDAKKDSQDRWVFYFQDSIDHDDRISKPCPNGCFINTRNNGYYMPRGDVLRVDSGGPYTISATGRRNYLTALAR